MPWSDWQPPFTWDEPRSFDAAVVASRSGSTEASHVANRPLDGRNSMVEEARARAMDAAVTVTVDGSGASPGGVIAQDVAAYGDGFLDPFGTLADGASVTLAQRIYYLSGWPGLTSRHHGFMPVELRTGDEGVDYAAIPGVDPDDPDQYVQWQDGAITQAQAWVGTVEGVHSGLTAGSTLAVLLDQRLGNNAPGWTPNTPAWSTADPAALYVNTTRAQQEFTHAFVDNVWSATDPVLAVVLDPGMASNPLNDSDGGFEGGYGTQGALTSLALRLLMPSWRYWIPEDLPLRQRQRDDGLGLSSARWRRGRSVQASNRWRGYR